MPGIPFTFRIDPKERAALDKLSKIEGRPINQILNDAVKGYLRQQGPREKALEASLAELRDYRKRDPGFRKAIASFVEAEATIEDPVEGKPVVGHFVDGKFVAGKPQSTGPVRATITPGATLIE
jgi:predicted transcriptional regulator